MMHKIPKNIFKIIIQLRKTVIKFGTVNYYNTTVCNTTSKQNEIYKFSGGDIFLYLIFLNTEGVNPVIFLNCADKCAGLL